MLTDFGVAHVFATTRLTRTGGVVGTAEYMSPEQARGKRATKESDLYSLGAVMYVMLTGRPPFTGKLASDILHKHQFSQFDKPSNYVSGIPRLLEEFVCKLLEKKPENRFPDALVAIRKLENARGRIEFEAKAKGDTQHGSGDRSSDHTLGGTNDQTQAGADPSELLQMRPGPATIARDMVREDLSQRYKKTPLQKFFDNTYVLIGLFALVVGTGYYMLQSNARDPAEEFATAQRLIATKAGPQWLTARDLLTGLLSEDLFPDRKAQMDQWIGQANQYEFCSRLKVNSPTDGSAESEIQRLVQKATNSYMEGNVTIACERIEAVKSVIEGDPAYEHLNSFLTESLAEWKQEEQVAAPKQLLSLIVTKAKQQIQGDRGAESARSILEAGILLYGQEPSVATQVAECRELLNSLAQQE